MNQFNLKKTTNTAKSFALFIVLTLLILNIQSNLFCHTACQDHIGACFDSTENGCYVCALNIYKDKDFTNPSNPCVLDNQRKIEFNELKSNSLSLVGYSTSKPISKTCGTMSLSGQYVNSDYLSKNFTDINTEHYELIIRFSIGYIGTWSNQDKLQLQINDGVSTTYHSWKYYCGYYDSNTGPIDDTENLCNVAGTDCVKIKQFIIQHNSSNVFLKWTALTTQSNPTVQNWGVKDLMIVTKTCHQYCDKCFGGNVNQCLSCSAGYYLKGNTCISKCPKLAIPQSQQCVDTCPVGYYQNGFNNFCEKCLDDCSLCSGPSLCLLWNTQAAKENAFTQNLTLWVIFILAGVGISGLLLWKFVLKKHFNKQGSNQSNSNQSQIKGQIDPNTSNISADYNELRNTQQNITNHLWIESMDVIDPIKIDVRKRKKRTADLSPMTTGVTKISS